MIQDESASLFGHDEKTATRIDRFPIAYAFNEKQLEEALEKLGATKEECCTYLNMGDVMKRQMCAF